MIKCNQNRPKKQFRRMKNQSKRSLNKSFKPPVKPSRKEKIKKLWEKKATMKKRTRKMKKRKRKKLNNS